MYHQQQQRATTRIYNTDQQQQQWENNRKKQQGLQYVKDEGGECKDVDSTYDNRKAGENQWERHFLRIWESEIAR